MQGNECYLRVQGKGKIKRLCSDLFRDHVTSSGLLDVDASSGAQFVGAAHRHQIIFREVPENLDAGRLPVTFYTGVDQLPPFEDYAMKGRTYRDFESKPLYPFGYGLGYTTFSYGGLKLPQNAIKAGDPLTVEVTVTNTGRREGDEVAQLYLSFPPIPGAPLRALRGFKRVHLKPHESKKILFELKERDLSMVSEAGEVMIAEGQYSLSVGGGQPNTDAPSIAGTFKVKGAKTLPE